MLKTVADNRDPASLAAHLRRRRFALFRRLLASVAGRMEILDVGGTPDFWRVMEFGDERVSITVLNRSPLQASDQSMRCVVGDARDMREFRDRQFDVVFSNSVIEHVGTFADQQSMAREVRRVGARYFVQTPNKYFPIEPHFLVPGFQFLPLRVRAGLLARRDLGWMPRAESYAAALDEVASIRLLSRREVRRLFPEAQLYTERFLGLSKSFVVYHGWS